MMGDMGGPTNVRPMTEAIPPIKRKIDTQQSNDPRD